MNEASVEIIEGRRENLSIAEGRPKTSAYMLSRKHSAGKVFVFHRVVFTLILLAFISLSILAYLTIPNTLDGTKTFSKSAINETIVGNSRLFEVD